jgi:DNA-binding CsgD family transcriptional regulator
VPVASAVQPWLPTEHRPSSCYLLEGPAGIGKTHRFSELLAVAAKSGVRIMRAQPSEAETRLVGSALIDLCADVDDEEIASLPEVQANALMTALLRGSTEVGNPDAVSVAFSGVLRSLVSQGPLVIAIDDVQWIDQQTADVLAFAARRIPETGVGVLLARRTEPQGGVPPVVLDVCAALPSQRESLAGLPDGTIERLLHDQLGSGLPRADITTSVELAAGNPLFALELARSALAARERGVATDSTTLPASLYDAVGSHVAALDAPAREALAAAAALSKPQLRQLRSLDVDRDLAAAERAGLVRVKHGTITFTHPLYAAAAYDQLGAGERARLHSRLAEVVEGGEEQARHLALGASEPDEAIAVALDTARMRALARGAVSAALDAAQLALSATPDGSSQRTQRQVQIGDLLFRTGSTDQALTQLRSAADEAATDRDRSYALHTLARFSHNSLSLHVGHELETEALALVGDDLELKADILIQLAVSMPDDYDGGLQYAIQARELLDQLPHPDQRQLAVAMTNEAGARFYIGAGCDVDSLRRAAEIQAGDTTLQVADRALCALAYVLLWYDDFRGAREAFGRSRQMAIDEGDEHGLTYVLRYLAMLEIRAGRWIEAERLIEEYAELAERCQLFGYLHRVDADRAKIAAYRGNTALAIEIGEEHIERGIATDQLMVKQVGHGLRGLAAFVDGEPHLAASELDQFSDIFRTVNAVEPGLHEYAGEHLEALVLAGRNDDAAKAIDQLIEAAEPLGRTVILAAAARGSALLLAERGDLDAALESAEHALALYQTIERPLETASAHLVKGQIHRRLRQKALARTEFTRALAVFNELGASGYAERTQNEIDRIGGRAAAPLELTETERRVAELAASGMTRAEIATSLFISTHTVAANLTRVFRKLGVRNRIELAARLDGKEDAG